MTIHASRELVMRVAAADTADDKHALQHVFLRRFAVRMQDEAVPAYAEHAWQLQSHTTRQSGVIAAEIAYSKDAAVRLIRNAALEGGALAIEIGFPDGSLVFGNFNLTDYEVFAETGDALRIAFTAHSCSALGYEID